MAALRKHDHTLDGSDWDLSTLALTDAPVDQLARNQKARRVDLSNNQITKLDPSFTALTHLVVLDISKNRLVELPENFGNLNKLIRLDLYENKLKTLPPSFGQLTRLKWLDLKGNPLESSLLRVSGDCSNAKQCEICAKNVVKFMVQETRRVDALNLEKERKLRERQELERQLVEKNKLQKEKKKAKVARRNARKAQISSDDNDGDVHSQIIDSKFDNYRKERTNRSIFSYLLSFIRIIIFLIMFLGLIFIGLAIGLHLQYGNKLESFNDIIVSLQNALTMFKDYETVAKDVSILFRNILNHISNWRQTFNINLNITNN